MKHTTGPCPLGNKCATVIDEETIEHCPWHVEMSGKDATGQEHDTWKCAMAWMPILQIEVAGTNRTVAKAVQSHRNETTKRQNIALQAMQKIEGNHASINDQ